MRHPALFPAAVMVGYFFGRWAFFGTLTPFKEESLSVLWLLLWAGYTVFCIVELRNARDTPAKLPEARVVTMCHIPTYHERLERDTGNWTP